MGHTNWVAGALEVEAEGAGVLVFLVDDDEVVWVELRCDGGGELRGAEHGGESLQAEVRGEEKAEGSGGEGERCSVHSTPSARPRRIYIWKPPCRSNGNNQPKRVNRILSLAEQQSCERTGK